MVLPAERLPVSRSIWCPLRGAPDKGNIANYDDRITWIKDSLWPAHQRQLQTPGAVEGLLHRDFDSQVARYRQLTPEAIGRDALKAIPPPSR